MVSNQNEINKISTTNSAGGTTQVSEVSSAIQLPGDAVRDKIGAAVIGPITLVQRQRTRKVVCMKKEGFMER